MSLVNASFSGKPQAGWRGGRWGRWMAMLAVGMAVLWTAAACGQASLPEPTATVPSQDPTVTEAPPEPTPTTPAEEEPTPTEAPDETEAPVEVTISEHPNLGSILVDGEGQVLYLFTNDEREMSNCAGGCLEAWPPLLSEDMPEAGEGIAADRLTTFETSDGSMQVAYNGWPLYYFAQDAAPGDAQGQDLNGVWFMVSPHGGPVQTSAEVQVTEHPELGEILTDASGRTLYLFTNDEDGMSNCDGDCALNWPPMLTVEDPSAGDGADSELLGTATRASGGEQVTYNGWPLYYFALDAAPSDAVGQGANDVWFAVTSEGEASGG